MHAARILATCLAALLPAAARAAVILVEDAAGLVAAIENARPGDELVLADGTYRLAGVTCATAATADAPIVVRAASPLGAVVELEGTEGFKVTGAHWRFEGLDVVGVCADHSTCEHAFHVTGAAHGFVLRTSRVRDFNAQLKVNAAQVDGTWIQPDHGLVERSELYDAAPRQTSNPVTKLNIDTGRGWVVRDNFIHDFAKASGDRIAYGAFMKSGGEEGLFERNLVVCSSTGDAGGTRIGLSFGGGGTAPAFCAPTFDAEVPCVVEHRGGTMRNNVVAGCSDVGIYLNRAAETQLLFNTLIETAGIDFRFATSTGLAQGNLLSGRIRDRDGASHTEVSNLASVSAEQFASWYEAPARGDLRIRGDVTALIGAADAHRDAPSDYCVRARPAAPTVGALEHALGSCATVPPPGPVEPGNGGSGGGGGGGHAGDVAGAGGGGAGGMGGSGAVDDPPARRRKSGDGGCAASGGAPGVCTLLPLLALRNRRRRRGMARSGGDPIRRRPADSAMIPPPPVRP